MSNNEQVPEVVWVQLFSSFPSAYLDDPREVHDNGKPVYKFILASTVAEKDAEIVGLSERLIASADKRGVLIVELQDLRSNHQSQLEQARRENDMLRRALEALAERGSPTVVAYVKQQIELAEAARDQPVRETEIEQAVYQAMFTDTNVGEG